MIRRFLIMVVILLPLTADANTNFQRLIGNIDSIYNIRSDILTYINHTVTPFSTSWKALIKIAQNQNFLYYHAKTYAEANKVIMENSVAQRCLTMEYNGDTGYYIFKKIESMMGDTTERLSHIFETSNYFFGKRGFTHVKIKREDLKIRCASGNYG